jgi:hypothetical protein
MFSGDQLATIGEANVVGGTPSIFINGEFYFGARDFGSLHRFVATKFGDVAGLAA